MCFCGNKIQDTPWDELVSYFSADEVKAFQDEIKNKIDEIDKILEEITALNIDVDNFYPSFAGKAKEI